MPLPSNPPPADLREFELFEQTVGDEDVLVTVMSELDVLVTTIGDVQGLQGPQGDKGDKGDKGDQGERGLQGETGGAGTQRVVKLPDGPLSMGRVVRVSGARCFRVTAQDVSYALAPIGVTDSSASAADQEVGVVLFGPIEDDTWDFSPGEPVLVGPVGELTQAPSDGWAYARVIGFATTRTQVFVNPQQPILQIVEGEADG